MDFNIHSDDFTNVPDETLEEIIQHYPPGRIGSSTPYSTALAEKHRRQKMKEEAEARRHQEIQTRLAELKKPHRPSFWLLVASVTLAFVAAVAAILSLPQVQKAVFGNPHSQEKIEQLHPSAHKSLSPKLEIRKK